MSVINTNYLALVSQNNLVKSQNALGSAIERLSSGLRINSAKDDAAGQAIANRFTANIRGLAQASRNANDGISIAQTTEGALNEINNNLQRIRELSVQAANGSNSASDLQSIQAEVQQRLDEIDRVSAQTQFNGVRVLAQENSLTVQVGANDNETISINLRQITANTLGMNGFSVSGKSVINNTAANVNDLTRAGGTETSPGSGVYTVNVKHDAVTSAQAFDRLENGNTVTVGPTTYTYNASTGDFSSAAKTATAGEVTALATKHTPGAGQTATGVYTTAAGGSTEFTVASDGTVTIGGEAAYITAKGELTTNKNDAGTEAATAAKIFAAVGATTGNGNTIAIGGVTYTGTATADQITYQATSSKETVKAALDAAAAGGTIKLGSGVFSHTVTFTAAGGKSSDTYIDNSGNLTTTGQFDVQYTVDPVNGGVTVSGGTGTGDYEPKIGATAYVSASGKLTTDTTSVGSGTKDPLALLDKALATVDSLRSELGAIQNRFQSTIANLSNTVNNLSAARSRIEDADYAVEVSNMTRAQILQQAGTSVLAQANQVPQTVLSLLR